MRRFRGAKMLRTLDMPSSAKTLPPRRFAARLKRPASLAKWNFCSVPGLAYVSVAITRTRGGSAPRVAGRGRSPARIFATCRKKGEV